MKVRALLSFNAFGYLKQEGEVFDIEDKGIKADLELIGFIEPIIEKAPKKTKSE